MTPLTHPKISAEAPLAESPDAASPARAIARSERLQLVLAGALWAVAACILAWRGVGWLLPVAWWPAWIVVGAGIGWLKARFILVPVARKVIVRIHGRGPGAPIAGFLSVRSWVAVVIMMAGGHALRLTTAPRPVLGVLYVAIAAALLIASRAFWRAHALGWGEISPSAPTR